MSLAAMMTVTEMADEIYRLCGNLGVLQPAAGGPIERAINDAFQAIVFRYRHAEFMEQPPYYFQAASVTTNGTNTANSMSVTLSNATLYGYNTRLIGGVLSYDLGSSPTFGDASASTIVGVTLGVNPALTLTVTPAIATAHTAEPCLVVLNRYPMPTQTTADSQTNRKVFFIYDVTNVTRPIPMKQVDVRVFDRSARLAGMSTYYARVNNDVVLYPAPYDPTITDTFQLRYALRPAYRSYGVATDTLAPLPEEWQRIVMMEAFAMLLDDQREHERAEATRQAAGKLAIELQKPWMEEIEDADAALTPRLAWW